MSKDKITKEVIEFIKEIEKDKRLNFQKRKKKLLQKYKDIYNVNKVSFDDLIARKIFLKKSRDSYLNILLSLILSAFVSYIYNQSAVVLNDSISGVTRVWSNVLVFVIIVVWSILISSLINGIVLKGYKSFAKYNTNEFEIEIIDSILREHFHLDDIKAEIVQNYNKTNKVNK